MSFGCWTVMYPTHGAPGDGYALRLTTKTRMDVVLLFVTPEEVEDRSVSREAVKKWKVMAPYEVQGKLEAGASNELRTVRERANEIYQKMTETSVAGDPCSENQICSSKKGQKTDSTTSLHSCSCGPECGPDKCEGRKNISLVSWDERRTKIFILLIAAFAVWLLIYIPISVMTMKDSNKSE